jgi:hypothetical protein
MAEDIAQSIFELISSLLDKKFSELINQIQEYFSASLGQSLMQFSDLLGSKIDETMDAVKETKALVEELKTEKELEKKQAAELSELIKETVTDAGTEETVVKRDVVTPSITTTPSTVVKETPPPVSEPQKPPIVKPTEPELATEMEEIPQEVNQIFDGISNAVLSKVSAGELFQKMDDARNSIVKVFRWHPVLYELASFSRRISKLPPDEPFSADVSSLLVEKITDWKTRIAK